MDEIKRWGRLRALAIVVGVLLGAATGAIVVQADKPTEVCVGTWVHLSDTGCEAHEKRVCGAGHYAPPPATHACCELNKPKCRLVDPPAKCLAVEKHVCDAGGP